MMVMLALGAWDSWRRVTAVERIAAVTETSSDMFTGLHNLRVDRAMTFRDLSADRQFSEMNAQLRNGRDHEVPALKAALVALDKVDYPGRRDALASLEQATKSLFALQQESATAILQPKTG